MANRFRAFLFPSLSRVRLYVQIIMLFLTLWGANMVGHYTAEKISTALPALSCAYDQQNGAYCVLVPLQHQIKHRASDMMTKAQEISLKILLPLVITLVSFLIFFFVLGKAFCGWVCPIGTLQEWLSALGRRLKRPLHSLQKQHTKRVRPIKWLLLLSLVFAFPLLTGLGLTPAAFGSAYCEICPARIATTLLTASPYEFAINHTDPWRFMLGALANTLFGFILLAALVIRQPFCRICPMLALNAVFKHLSLTRLVKHDHSKCQQCGICAKACPMDIHEIHEAHSAKAFHDDCILCGRCAEFCPDNGIIEIKTGPFSLFRASRAYYKKRIQTEQPDGTPKANPKKMIPIREITP